MENPQSETSQYDTEFGNLQGGWCRLPLCVTFCRLRWHLLAQMPSQWQNVRSLWAASKASSWSMPSLSWNQQGPTSQCAVLTLLVHLRGVGQGTSRFDVELELSEVDEIDDLGQL